MPLGISRVTNLLCLLYNFAMEISVKLEVVKNADREIVRGNARNACSAEFEGPIRFGMGP